MPTRKPRVLNDTAWLTLYYSLPHYQEGSVGAFSISKKPLVAGTTMKGYNYQTGGLFQLKYNVSKDGFIVTSLTEQEHIWMSTTQLEMAGLVNPVAKARGHVLTSGLGLGCFPWLVADKPEVETVTVVEQSLEVIKLVGPQIEHPKILIHHYNLETFLTDHPELKYDFIYLDIWGDLLGPLNAAVKASELARPHLAKGGECRLWLQELIDRVLSKLPKEPSLMGFVGPQEPCLVCSKTLRADYAGLCMDCADSLGLSSLFIKERGND